MLSNVRKYVKPKPISCQIKKLTQQHNWKKSSSSPGIASVFKKILIGFLYFTERMRSKLSVTVYLCIALYGSTTLQSRSFLKNIENFLCKKKLVNNRSIPSMHAERKITVRSHEHSFTPYPSLSPYRWTE